VPPSTEPPASAPPSVPERPASLPASRAVPPASGPPPLPASLADPASIGEPPSVEEPPSPAAAQPAAPHACVVALQATSPLGPVQVSVQVAPFWQYITELSPAVKAQRLPPPTLQLMIAFLPRAAALVQLEPPLAEGSQKTVTLSAAPFGTTVQMSPLSQ